MVMFTSTGLLVLQAAAAMADSATATVQQSTASFPAMYGSSSPWNSDMGAVSTPTGQVTTMAMSATKPLLASTSGSLTDSTGQPQAPASSWFVAASVPSRPLSPPYSTHLEKGIKGPLISINSNLSEEEANYLNKRKVQADLHLQGWIGHIFGRELKQKLGTGNTPTLGLATSGGGVRSLLTSAGVLESLSQSDHLHNPHGNLYDAMTVVSSVSTTSWLPFIMIRDGYTLREYVDRVLKPQLEKDLLPHIGSLPISQRQRVKQDLQSRTQNTRIKASMSSADMWSRVLAFKLLSGPNGQDNIKHTQLVDTTLSDLVKKYDYPNAGQPLPVLNMLAMAGNACMPTESEMPFEVTPFRSGTWAAGDDNFTPLMFKTRHLDTQMSKVGQALGLTADKNIEAVVGWDNLGLLAGISSFPMNMVNCQTNHKSSPETYRKWVDQNTAVAWPPNSKLNNPFFMHEPSLLNGSHYVREASLRLVDGSESSHGIPLLALLHPERNVDVIVAVDSTGGSNDYPDGSQMLAAAKLAAGLKSYKERLPEMPSTTDMWKYQMPEHKATVFGCYEPNATTIIYLPNANMGGSNSTAPETKWKYSKKETADMFENGVQVGNQGNEEKWSKCMGCFVLKKTDLVFNDTCGQCWTEFCYKRLDVSKPNGPGFELWRQPPNRLGAWPAIPDFPDFPDLPEPGAGSWTKPTVAAFALVAAAAWSLL